MSSPQRLEKRAAVPNIMDLNVRNGAYSRTDSPARERQPEVIEPMIEALTGDHMGFRTEDEALTNSVMR